MSILTVEHLTHGFGDRAIFSDVSFRLLRGEHIGLVGANGEGKSTFFNMITGHLTPDEGKIEWAKHVRAGYLDQHTVLEQGQTIRDVLQSAFGYLFDLEAQMNAYYAEMAEADAERMEFLMEETGSIQETLEHHDFYIIDSKVDEIGRALGLADIGMDRDVTELSGGQRQRVGIARALILNPVFLVCDEPVSALDVSVQAQIVNLLKKIQRERKLASIFISHDINVVRYISDRIVVMYLGHIVEEAPKDELIHHPKHPYTKSLLASVPNMNPRERKRHVALEGEIPSPMDPPSGCVFHTRCPYATDKCRTEVPEYKESGDGHWVRCHEV